jgi:hypothetical protein
VALKQCDLELTPAIRRDRRTRVNRPTAREKEADVPSSVALIQYQIISG